MSASKPTLKDDIFLLFGTRGLPLKLAARDDDEAFPGHIEVLLRASHAIQRACRLAVRESMDGFDEVDYASASDGIELITALAAKLAERMVDKYRVEGE